MPTPLTSQLTDAEINTRDNWGGAWNELETALRGLSQTQPGARFADEPQCEAVRQTLCELRHPHRIGDTIGPYRLERLLGAGGMGTVYLARHLTLDQPAAVKVLNLDGSLNSQAIRRFRKEMETAGKLVHPHIVRALHAGDEQGVPYLAMEFVEGVDLSSVLAQHGPMNAATVAAIARQAAVALQHAHQAGVVHRDVKPSNLMLTPEGTIKLLDLGLALDRERQAAAHQQLTRTGQALGTIDFVAPEQLEDPSRVDARADIYSLGATMFALLSGTAPWDHRHYASPAKQVADVLGGERPSLKNRRASSDDRLDSLVERMLHRDPRQRPESLADVIPQLEAIAGNANPRDLLNPAVDTSPAAAGTPIVAQPAARAGTGRPGWLAAFGVAAAALALVAAGAIWLQNDNGSLRIRLAPGQTITVEAASVEPEIIAPQDQRTAAIWTIARGGRVTIGSEQKPITIRTVDKLPAED
ncbi:MAG: serine/threonine protein kinase, partial [Planctomycetales bacterium]|nr:serine/threonine protein kinase [Planctomycetales bacterium]